jgi:hypothetical protein
MDFFKRDSATTLFGFIRAISIYADARIFVKLVVDETKKRWEWSVSPCHSAETSATQQQCSKESKMGFRNWERTWTRTRKGRSMRSSKTQVVGVWLGFQKHPIIFFTLRFLVIARRKLGGVLRPQRFCASMRGCLLWVF